MKNFKKFAFLILIICMIFMVGSVSAVNVEDNLTSENSIDDLSVAPDESGDIVESDVLSSNTVEPTGASDTFDNDDLSSSAVEPIGDGDPYMWVYYHTKDARYHSSLMWTIFVRNHPNDNLDLKVSADGFDITEVSSTYRNYVFNPETGILHFDEITDNYPTIYVKGTPNRVGNVSVSVEMLREGVKLANISDTIPVSREQVDLVIEKSLSPFLVQVPTESISGGSVLLLSSELLRQISYINPEDSYLLADNSDIPIVKIGDEVIWYIRVVNIGRDTAYDVNITDVLPDGLIFKDFSARTGSTRFIELNLNMGNLVTYEDGTFHFPSLSATQYIDLTIVTIANKIGLITNIANVTSEGIDSNPDNNEENESVRVIGEEPLDEPQQDNSTDEDEENQQDNSTDEDEAPQQDNSTDEVNQTSENRSISLDNNANLDISEDIQEDSVSESVQPSAVKSATGNPVLLALIALFVATGNIFRRKK